MNTDKIEEKARAVKAEAEALKSKGEAEVPVANKWVRWTERWLRTGVYPFHDMVEVLREDLAEQTSGDNADPLLHSIDEFAESLRS